MDQLLGNQPIMKTSSGVIDKSTTVYLPVFLLAKTSELIKMLDKVVPSNWSKWVDVESSIKKTRFAVEVANNSLTKERYYSWNYYQI